MKNLSIKYLTLGLSLIFIVAAALFYFQKEEKSPIKQALITKATPINYTGALPISVEDISTEATPSLTDMAAAVTAEALKAFSDSGDVALPLMSHWDVGETDAMNPTYMLSRLEQGEHVLVSWKLDPYYADTIGNAYYEESIKKAAELNLPLVFILPAPESALTEDSYYKTLAQSENPNVVDTDGNILNTLSPFGPDHLWSEVGEQWSSTSLMVQIQEWYPNPPLVVFINENAASKLSWSEVETSSRYVDNYPSGKDDEYKRTLVGAEWIEKYRQMHTGVKEGFIKEDWKNSVKFVSYNDFSDDLGQISTWMMDTTLTNQYLDICPFTVDGTTVNFDLTKSVDYTTIDAPQIPVNNLPFMLQEAKRNNPSFMQQLSITHNSDMTDPALYRGLTQFGLWFLRPSVIRQDSPTSTLTELEPLFSEMSDSVELIHNSDILSDFWKNGTLVSNGASDLNSNIPEQYIDDPRWFLLDADATNSPRPWTDSSNIAAWAFALVKGDSPNREWLVYAQSPENEISSITVGIPDYGDVLIDSGINGSFYILSESTTETKTIITTDTNNGTEESINPYLETVNLPECNANNPEVQFIENNSDWDHINDDNKRIFCVAPGDYIAAGPIEITTSGTEENKKFILLNNGNDIHPGKLDRDDLARVNFKLNNVNFWVIDRMSDWESYTDKNPILIDSSSYNIINRYFMDNVGNGIYIHPGSHNNTIQNCRIQRDNISIFHDRAAIGLNSDSKYNEDAIINITNTKILNNEVYNFVDGFQAIRTAWREDGITDRIATNYVNYEGTIVDNNHFYVDNKIYTDCNGNADLNGNCAYAENAIDLKAGSENPDNPIIITNNKMWGFRQSDTTNSTLGDPGSAMPIHYNVKNVIISDNIIFDSTIGFNIGDPLKSLSFSMEKSEITNNIFFNIESAGLLIDSSIDISITKNLFKNFSTQNENIWASQYWITMYNSTGDILSDNFIINTDNREARFSGNLEENTFSNNKYYNSLNGDIPISSDSIYSIDPSSNFSDIVFTTDNYTNNPREITLSQVLNNDE